jgi:lipopolysaccharide cholinephosphotransferase
MDNKTEWKTGDEQKKSWTIQLQITEVFNEICYKNNLRWYAFFGTLLGAVRHKGFIPWDDDLDLAMPRTDYDRFLEIAQSELYAPYFLQTTLTDEDCYIVHASIRNSKTTGGYEYNMRKRINNGIGIDIVPLEGCENNMFTYRIKRIPIKLVSFTCNTYVNNVNNSFIAYGYRKILHLLFPGLNYRRLYKWIQVKCAKRLWEEYDKVACIALADYKLAKMVWNKNDFDDIVMMEFESTTIPVPVGFDNILNTTYGDYMKYPPVDKRGNKHGIICFPEIPYKEYCAKNYDVVY